MRNQKPSSFQLTDDQKEALNTIKKKLFGGNGIATLKGYAGTGKAQPYDSEIITPGGTCKMGEIKVGDEVIDHKGNKSSVLGVYDQGVKPLYKVGFTDGTTVKCCDEHLWKVFTCGDRNKNMARKKCAEKYNNDFVEDFSVLTTSKLQELGVRKKSRKRWRFRVPVCDSVKFNSSEVPIDPYLLGILIGDGSLSGTTPAISSGDSFVINECKNIVHKNYNDIDLKLTESSGITYRLSGTKGKTNRITKKLRKLNLFGKKSHEKFIPESYLINDYNVRVSLLQGLMDSDGYVNKRGHSIYYSTSSEKLKNDFLFLVRSLGCVGKFNLKTTTHRDSYRILINQTDSFDLFRLPRKQKRVKPKSSRKRLKYIKSIKKIGEKKQRCIKVDNKDELYLTTDFNVTHNTTLLQSLIDEVEDELNEIYLLAPTHKAAEVLGRRTNKSVRTVHSAFGLRPEWDGEGGYKFVKTDEEPIKFLYKSLLAIDEASMVDDKLYNHIITVQNQYDLKVLFCGDPAQLPPVNHDLSPALEHDGYTLTDIVRQEAGNPILKTSENIRKNGFYAEIKEKFTGSGDGVYVENDVEDFFKSAINSFDTQRYRDTGDFSRVLAYRNETVNQYNETFRSALYDNSNIEYLEGEWLVCMEPWTPISSSKEYEPIIQNSEEFVVKDRDIVIEDGWVVWELIVGSYPSSKDERRIKVLHSSEQNRFERRLENLKQAALKEEYRWPEYYDLKEKFAKVDYCFAMTTHKSQGSTFNRVYVDLKDIQTCYKSEERDSLAYVAATRPSHRLTVLNPK